MSNNANNIIVTSDEVDPSSVPSNSLKRPNEKELPNQNKYARIEKDDGNNADKQYSDDYLRRLIGPRRPIPVTNTTAITNNLDNNLSHTLSNRVIQPKKVVPQNNNPPSINSPNTTAINTTVNSEKDNLAKNNEHTKNKVKGNRPTSPINVNENSKITNYVRPMRDRTPARRRPISYFELNDLDDDVSFNNTIKLNRILTWINYRLFEKKFNKQWSGIYLWSHTCSVGKTTLCQVLSQLFTTYNWVFGDKEWQQRWEIGKNYNLIVYDAMNSDLLPFRQIERHGDKEDIVVTRRNQHTSEFIQPKTPFIINSNKPMEELGYREKGFNMIIWRSRLLSICLDNGCLLFPLIEKIIREYNLYVEEDDPLPRGFDDCFYF